MDGGGGNGDAGQLPLPPLLPSLTESSSAEKRPSRGGNDPGTNNATVFARPSLTVQLPTGAVHPGEPQPSTSPVVPHHNSRHVPHVPHPSQQQGPVQHPHLNSGPASLVVLHHRVSDMGGWGHGGGGHNAGIRPGSTALRMSLGGQSGAATATAVAAAAAAQEGKKKGLAVEIRL
jgi:hypothetical protein